MKQKWMYLVCKVKSVDAASVEYEMLNGEKLVYEIRSSVYHPLNYEEMKVASMVSWLYICGAAVDLGRGHYSYVWTSYEMLNEKSARAVLSKHRSYGELGQYQPLDRLFIEAVKTIEPSVARAAFDRFEEEERRAPQREENNVWTRPLRFISAAYRVCDDWDERGKNSDEVLRARVMLEKWWRKIEREMHASALLKY